MLQWRPYAADFDQERDEWLDERTFGSSEFVKTILGALWGTPPGIATELDARVNAVLSTLVDRGLVSSVFDANGGGLAVALAQATLPAGIGARIEVSRLGHGRGHTITLFGEAGCTVLMTCPRSSIRDVEEIAKIAKLGGLQSIGTTGSDLLEVLIQGNTLISASIADLNAVFSAALESHLTEEVTA